MIDMIQMLKAVHQAREQVEKLKYEKKELQLAFENDPKYLSVSNKLSKAIIDLETCEAIVKESASLKFANDGIKTNPGYTIKEKTKILLRDLAGLRDWCIQNFRPALILNEKAIVEAAKSKLVPENFYEYTEIPQVQIASDLSKI